MENEYLGFKQLALSEDEINSIFREEQGETVGFLKNEYLEAIDEDNNHIGIFKYNGSRFLEIPYKVINSKYSGKIKPKNNQQRMAIDMLYDNNTTVKIISGKFGTGKNLAPLYSNV